MEGRRRNKEKSSVLGCRMVLCIFFPLYEVSTCEW
jgi:hypothetical protein